MTLSPPRRSASRRLPDSADSAPLDPAPSHGDAGGAWPDRDNVAAAIRRQRAAARGVAAEKNRSPKDAAPAEAVPWSLAELSGGEPAAAPTWSPADVESGRSDVDQRAMALWPRPVGGAADEPTTGTHRIGAVEPARDTGPDAPAADRIEMAERSRTVAELVDRLDGDDVVDADDAVAEIVALGVADDTTARKRYGMSVDGLGISVLAHLRQRRATVRAHRGNRRAPAKRAYLTAAMLRCALYLGPLSVAVAAIRPLGRVGWLVPALTLLLGWSAAQALTSVGAAVARTAGPAPAARLAGGGFAAVAGIWCAFVWVAPAAWLGPSRMLAGVIGVGGLTALAGVTAALVTRSEADVVRWSLPCWLLAAVSVATVVGDTWAAGVPIETLLPAAIVVAAVRAYRPVIGRAVPSRPPLNSADVRRGVGYLIVGAAQAACVALLWRAGPPGATSPAALPLLLAVPALETLVGWHMHQVEAGLDAAESGRDYRKHIRSVAVATVAALMPPLAAGFALAAAAYQIPYGTATRDGVLALAAGTLLGGLFAATFLLAARGRTAVAATLATAAPLAIVALPFLPVPPLDPLPGFVAVFLVTDLLGLLAVAYTAADHETRIAQDLRRPS